MTELPVEEVVSSEDPLLLAKEIPEEIPENSISSLASSAKSLETAEPFPEPGVYSGVYSGQKLEDLDFSGAVRMPAPVYPSRARKMEWEGDVTVSFVINKKGKIESIIIEESTGYELLDKTVFNTVKKGWRFPRRDDPVRVWKTFSFRLI
ncbi:MAG: hypothetical protein B6241_15350 [Spirochaetaceae bacterium 4572_59]|nr:MAG: hypothetical protein B6241_15350 [Spirochaetaceae bacterium 4572_59]